MIKIINNIFFKVVSFLTGNMKERKRVIFLDIDGVINITWPRESKETMEERDELEDIILKEEGYSILPYPNYRAISILNILIEQTDAKIVISSSWRSDGIEAVQKTLRHENINCEVIGLTPFIEGAKRGKEISKWLKNNKDVTDYVILDDEEEFLLSQKKHLVRTTAEDGLDFANLKEALEILK
jgi:hypothetical protein